MRINSCTLAVRVTKHRTIWIASALYGFNRQCYRHVHCIKMWLSRLRIPFFRIFYSGTFTLFVLVLTALLLITPGDHIYQSFRAGELFRIITVGGVYVLTFVIAVFIYAARLFSTRSALANIPREWKLGGDEKENPGIGLGMGKRMGRVVRESWERSAIIAFESTPRDLRGNGRSRHVPVTKGRRNLFRKEGDITSKDAFAEPVWGAVHNAGWSGPSITDMPDLHFESVIAELGHIIEAKAVSFAPSDPEWELARERDEKQQERQDDAAPPDPIVVDLLRRPVSMGLREYVEYLTSIGIITTSAVISEFLVTYEATRFGGRLLQEEDFRHLMSLFSHILRGMKPPNQAIIDKRREDTKTASVDNQDLDRWTDDQREPVSAIRIQTPTLRSRNSTFSQLSRSDAGATAYTAPSRARLSRDVSTASYNSQSTESVIHHKRQSAASVEQSQFGTDSESSSSAGSFSGSLIRTSMDQVSLDLPRAEGDELDIGTG